MTLRHVGLVVDRVRVGAAEQRGVLAQQPGADGVEGGGEHAAGGLFAEQVGEPQPQLAGGAHAERDGEDLAGIGGAGGEQVGDAMGQGPRLAGAGSGDDQQRACAVSDGLGLLGREPGEQRVRAGCARAGAPAPRGLAMASPPVMGAGSRAGRRRAQPGGRRARVPVRTGAGVARCG